MSTAFSTRAPAVSTASGSRPPALSDLPEIPDLRSLATVDARILSAVLFQRLALLEEGTPEHAYVRNTLVELNLSLVRFAAARFSHRSEAMEDILQVGTIGLIKAINRFDVEREVEFSSFALPNIEGEIKRFFRDATWAVRVPRRLQELRIDLARASDALEQRWGRLPTDAELAEHLNVDEAEIREGRQAANGYSARSLDAPAEDETAPAPGSQRRLAQEERAYETVECVVALKPVVATLPERDRQILSMRFVEELTQREIGERLGISQMHVSRLLSHILATLRDELLRDGDEDDERADGTDVADARSLAARS
ncbi:SigB/SigF/SigG family RNA polymerase sigma factor [Streptomyces sp. NPDC051907]|uniref:SigB/SigF/SigG family RNA polymerase sigma factor n=1 Tax=Streptomyces sp. NPDC051907 TaxID=3155284 RepID=UPI003426F9ED